MGNVLLIEDNEDAAALVSRTLKNVTIVVARTLGEAKLVLNFQAFDLILLDCQLPDGDGFEFFKTLKANALLSLVPVIMLTSIADSETVAKSFDAGVDDYITKPFDRREFLARVNRRMRDGQPLNLQTPSIVNLGALAIDKDLQRAHVQGTAVELTSIEFKILMVLVKSPNEAIDRELIFKTVWPDDTANRRAIDTHVSKLRKKLGADLIESVHGVGYRLSV